jgi:hypothetical protein
VSEVGGWVGGWVGGGLPEKTIERLCELWQLCPFEPDGQPTALHMRVFAEQSKRESRYSAHARRT